MFFAFALALIAAETVADGERIFGAPMPAGARKIEEGRYISPRSYHDTIEFYDKLYKGSGIVRFRPIINAPGVKAVHVQNLKGGGWTGINIYELKGQTRLFVLKSDAAPPAPAKKK
jgi:hypothetical protein